MGNRERRMEEAKLKIQSITIGGSTTYKAQLYTNGGRTLVWTGLTQDDKNEAKKEAVEFAQEWGYALVRAESGDGMIETRERRALPVSIEVREVPGEPTRFVGQPIVYDSWSGMIQGAFRERIRPGAFDAHLATQPDIVCSVDHDLHRLLGRTASGTLKIDQRADGLWIEVTDPQTTYSRDLMQCVKRGDVRGMSFMFDCKRDEWHHADGQNSRDVLDAEIYEVSFVNFPAYPATIASARSLELAAANVEPRMLTNGWVIKNSAGKYWDGNRWMTSISFAEEHSSKAEAEHINDRDGLGGQIVYVVDGEEQRSAVPVSVLARRLREVESLDVRYRTGDVVRTPAGVGEVVAIQNTALGQSQVYVKLSGGKKWFDENEIALRTV